MNFITTVNFKDKKNIILLVLLFLILSAAFFFDKGLSVGLSLLVILSGIVFLVLNKLGFKDKKIYLLFLIVLAIHLYTTLFMHYANFQPFSGGQGDYLVYQKSAVEASQCFRKGEFLTKNIVLKYPDFYTIHCYPIIVGAVYALTLPEEIIGLMVNVWLVAVSIILVYLIILEISGLSKNAFLIGLIAGFYPSYIFNSGLLLKDPIEIFFVITGLLFLIKTVKKLTWYNFLILYLAILCATHFRFYVGYALIATFVFSWFLLSKIDLKKRIIYGIVFIIILGFIPLLATSYGYYGINSVRNFINPKKISFYRKVAYNPTPVVPVSAKPAAPAVETPASTKPVETPASTAGFDSTFSVENSPLGFLKSFTYVLLGPFPWQIKNLRQSLALFETMPWYLLLLFIIDGIIICFKKRVRYAVPLLFFSILVITLIAVFDTNYGLIVRIRIPAFISLACFAAFSSKESIIKKINYFKNVWNSRVLQYK